MFPCDERLKQPQTQPQTIGGTPEKGDIRALHYGASIPRYMVEPLRLPLPSNASTTNDFKLIDFGSSFMSGTKAPEIRCPLPFRAPEAVLTKGWDTPADIWSLGCTVAIPSSSPRWFSTYLVADIFPCRWLSTIRLNVQQRAGPFRRMVCITWATTARVGRSGGEPPRDP